MGREIKRVPVDFEWPLNERWSGFLMPDTFDEVTCPGCARPSPFDGEPCGDGWSRRAQELHDMWYGKYDGVFRPEDNGSVPLTLEAPVVRAFAERNVRNAPEFYGRGEFAIRKEASRLCRLWNNMWAHHLNYDDIAALVAADSLRDFTHTFDPKREPRERWQRIDPPVVPTMEQVRDWSITSFNGTGVSGTAIRARCEREGLESLCPTCDGHGSLEAYEGQRDEADTWEREEPPTGEGWQLWETVSEGSPISPVFPTAEGLAQWLTTPASCWGATRRPMTIEQARGFVGVGWAPTGFITAGGVHDGAEYVGTEAALGPRD